MTHTGPTRALLQSHTPTSRPLEGNTALTPYTQNGMVTEQPGSNPLQLGRTFICILHVYFHQYRLLPKNSKGGNKMSHQGAGPATEPDSLSSVPGTHRVERTNSHTLSSEPQTCAMACFPTPHTINMYNFKKSKKQFYLPSLVCGQGFR